MFDTSDDARVWEVVLYQPHIALSADGVMTLDGLDEREVVVMAQGMTEDAARALATHLMRVEMVKRATELRDVWYAYRARRMRAVTTAETAETAASAAITMERVR